MGEHVVVGRLGSGGRVDRGCEEEKAASVELRHCDAKEVRQLGDEAQPRHREDITHRNEGVVVDADALRGAVQLAVEEAEEAGEEEQEEDPEGADDDRHHGDQSDSCLVDVRTVREGPGQNLYEEQTPEGADTEAVTEQYDH
eukprot:m.209018 g.209018  ORF g.209018 m.209018 type:complete len:142 (-) comp25438_c0_seq3:251-676(-)